MLVVGLARCSSPGFLLVAAALASDRVASGAQEGFVPAVSVAVAVADVLGFDGSGCDEVEGGEFT